MRYTVEEVSAGICTCTIRAAPVEKKINSMAEQGWRFESFEPIAGRFCLIFQRYKMLIVFSRENQDGIDAYTIILVCNNIVVHSEKI